VGLIRGREQEQQATLEPLPALRVLQAQRLRVRPRVWSVLRVDQPARLVWVSLLPELCSQEGQEQALAFGKPLREASTFPRSE